MVPKDFMSLLPSYANASAKSEYHAGLQKRRAVVASWCNGEYLAAHGLKAKIHGQLRTKGFPLRASTVANDVSLYRTAYRYLTASAEDKEPLMDLYQAEATAGCVP